MPDIWLQNGNPWEIKRPDIKYKIGFYGKVDNFKWTPEEVVSPPPLCVGMQEMLGAGPFRACGRSLR